MNRLLKCEMKSFNLMAFLFQELGPFILFLGFVPKEGEQGNRKEWGGKQREQRTLGTQKQGDR
jgi:hypothetical protein